MSDDEALRFMREQYEGVCFGDLDYLAETCIERLTRAVRAGYEGYAASCPDSGEVYRKDI